MHLSTSLKINQSTTFLQSVVRDTSTVVRRPGAGTSTVVRRNRKAVSWHILNET